MTQSDIIFIRVLKFIDVGPISLLPIDRRNFVINEFFNYLKDEDGQTSTEYILLVAVVAAIIFKFRGVLEEKLMGLVGSVFNKTDSLLQSN